MKLLILLSFCALTVFSQNIDDTFCNLNTIVSDDGLNLPIPTFDPNGRFQVSIEKNSRKNKFTNEIDEFYDGVNNIGISINTFAGQMVSTYSYYDQNELLLVEGDRCKVLKLNESFDLTPFYVLTYPNGTERIVTEFGLLLMDSSVKFGYLGSKKFIRGIPVREWQTCLYSKKDSATLKVTISFSNKDLWLPAVQSLGFDSVPVQVLIESKNSAGEINVEYNVYTRFRPGLLIEEEDYFVPKMVYCENRITKRPVPKIPSSFSFLLHAAESVENTDDLYGILRVQRSEFDYDRKLFRFDYAQNGKRITEIHDENTNLKYYIDNYHDNCSISVLEPINAELSPVNFFRFDENPPFEYLGQRRIRGINTDVWSAPRMIGNTTSIWEWHFMAEGWIVQESTAVKLNEPVLLVIYLKRYEGLNLKVKPIYFHLANFDSSRINLFDFDVSKCENIPNQHLRFTITSDKYEIMRFNKGTVRQGIMYAIQNATGLNLIRISQLETIYDNGVIFVLFTLLERSSLGLPDPVYLKDAINRLRSSVEGKRFIITFSDFNNEKYGIYPDSDSLTSLDLKGGRYVYNYIETGEITGYTGSSVAGYVIGFLIIGLVLGLVAGVFFILRRQSISLPGPLSFLNPNYNQA